MRRPCTGTHRIMFLHSAPWHAAQRQTTRHARCSAPRARHTAKQSSLLAFSPKGHGRAPNHGLRPRGWPMRPDAKPAPHADAVSQGGVEVCKGREGGTPAPAGCRRRTRCRSHAGGLAPPCGPSDHLQGTSGRVGRIMLGQSGRPREQGGGMAVLGFERTWAPGAPGRPARMVSGWPVLCARPLASTSKSTMPSFVLAASGTKRMRVQLRHMIL